jgi:hypothetical protein
MLFEKWPSLHWRLASRRLISNDYVNKTRLFEYWNQSDHALESEFPSAQAFLMVDKEPLVEVNNNQMKLIRFETGGKYMLKM